MRYRSSLPGNPEGISGRLLLSTPQNGKIVLDKVLFSLWQAAQGCTQAEITSTFRAPGASALTIAAGLACLAEAGLLVREEESTAAPVSRARAAAPGSASVSAVIVAYNGIQWLKACLDSVFAQSYLCSEVIVVDNASSDGTPDWVRSYSPNIRLIETGSLQSFAHALNLGMAAARGDYLLPLNQDILLDGDAVAQLAAKAGAPDIAAVAACLRFLWAPAFLNGLGNQVRALGWGTDNFIGYLDLGQFDDQQEIPSICLAAALINRQAWEKAGPLDEDFSMYYEDSEWSYRARLLGYHLQAAPRALVYHAFGGQKYATISETRPVKLRNVVVGRLRFTSKLLAGGQKTGRLLGYALQDLAGVLASLFTFKFKNAAAYFQGWYQWLHSRRTPLLADRETQAAVFAPWKGLPHPGIWHGLPELTWDMVCCYYLKKILSGQTRSFPEFSGLNLTEIAPPSCSRMDRFMLIWQCGEKMGAFRYLWRVIRWSFN